MTAYSKTLAVADVESSALEAEFERFETAWRAGSPPDIEQFYSTVSSHRVLSDSARRQRFLAELVMIDLERRWRARAMPASSTVLSGVGATVPDKPRLEDYLRRFPLLADNGALPIELIGVEYRARTLWGDAPAVAEYLARFPGQAGAVRSELSRVEREISQGGFSRMLPLEKADAGVPKYAASTIHSEQAISTSDEPQPAPKWIGRFEVREVLGAGGFGVVYRAFDPALQREVAIKVPRAEFIKAFGGTAAYLAEARTIARLDHPGIVPVYEAGCTDDGQCYVVTKLMVGGDLSRLIASGRPSAARSAEIVARVAEALHHAHTRGLVHRDIKPANILLDADGSPLVVDFGLALREEDFGSGPGFVGTLAYMSPEQAQDTGHLVDARSDIFSLGLVLFELLSGKSPYRGKSKEQLVQEITSCDPRPVRQLDVDAPQELDRICQKARAMRPSDRYATARDLANDLRAYLRRGDDGATGAWVVPAAIATVAAILLLAVGIILLAPGRTKQPPPAPPAVALAAPYMTLEHRVPASDAGGDAVFREVAKSDMPLEQGARVALDVALADGQKGYVYLFQFDEGQKAKRLWPAPQADLTQQKMVDALRYPADDAGVEFSAASGRTMVVVAVSASPLDAQKLSKLESVAFTFDDTAPQPPIFEFQIPEDPQREKVRSPGHPTRLLTRPKNELKRHFEAFSAIVFECGAKEPD
jgi:hypothetical protein